MAPSAVVCSQSSWNDGERSHMTTCLTLQGPANHLKTGTPTIYGLARAGNIPAHRAGRIWQFDPDELDIWLKSAGQSAIPQKRNQL